jgi:osmotically-inducible protein OsmY
VNIVLRVNSVLRKGARALLIVLAAAAGACAMVPQKSPEQAAADAATADRVYSALNADEVYYYRHVNVGVDNGVVQLSGYVWSTPAMYRAKQLAGQVPGVTRVVNQMELERNGNRGGGHSGSG